MTRSSSPINGRQGTSQCCDKIPRVDCSSRRATAEVGFGAAFLALGQWREVGENPARPDEKRLFLCPLEEGCGKQLGCSWPVFRKIIDRDSHGRSRIVPPSRVLVQAALHDILERTGILVLIRLVL
jgi:hypothetical protein